jgi:hypothetical protein
MVIFKALWYYFAILCSWSGSFWAPRIRIRNYFYAPEAHIIYLTVVSWFLISFVMGGSGSNRANKFLYAPAPPSLSVWALKPPSWALVHKTTYAPMIYTALCIMFWMWAYPLRVFWAPNGIRLSARCHFTGPKKLSNSRAQPPPTCPYNGYARIQKNYARGCINHRRINSYYRLSHEPRKRRPTRCRFPCRVDSAGSVSPTCNRFIRPKAGNAP